MKRKSRDWDLTLELSCHGGCPTDESDVNDDEIGETGDKINNDRSLSIFFP